VFGPGFNDDVDIIAGSEDFSVLATEIGRPCCFWIYGQKSSSFFMLFSDNSNQVLQPHQSSKQPWLAERGARILQ
jgi:hypothetical protein